MERRGKKSVKYLQSSMEYEGFTFGNFSVPLRLLALAMGEIIGMSIRQG